MTHDKHHHDDSSDTGTDEVAEEVKQAARIATARTGSPKTDQKGDALTPNAEAQESVEDDAH